MQKTLMIISICTGLIFLSACTPAGSQGSLTGQVWGLAELNGKQLVPGTVITAVFSSDGKVAGSSGCNQYSGNYTVSGSSITFSGYMVATMMACPQPVMDQETAYLKVLGGAKSYQVSGDQMTLKDTSNTVVATFKVESQSLSGTSWQATSYNNGKQAVVSVMNGTTLTAVFGSDGSLSGNSGCNTFNGTYKATGSQIAIGPLAATRMACSDPAGVMDQETQYLAALQSAATYLINGGKLELRTKDGALAADFLKK
jgi:heat shock protein HslJ